MSRRMVPGQICGAATDHDSMMVVVCCDVSRVIINNCTYYFVRDHYASITRTGSLTINALLLLDSTDCAL